MHFHPESMMFSQKAKEKDKKGGDHIMITPPAAVYFLSSSAEAVE